MQKIRKWMGSWWKRWCASWWRVLSETQEPSLTWEDEERKLGRDGAEHWVQSSEEPLERNGESSSWTPVAYRAGSVLHWVAVKSLAERKIWCNFGDILTSAPLNSVNNKQQSQQAEAPFHQPPCFRPAPVNPHSHLWHRELLIPCLKGTKFCPLLLDLVQFDMNFVFRLSMEFFCFDFHV